METEPRVTKLELPSDRPPIFVAAGIIKSEEQILQYSEAEQLAVQVVGSISENKHEPESIGPDFHFDKASGQADNSVRLRNPGSSEVSEYAPRAFQVAHDAGQLIFLAITAVAGEDPEEVLPRLAVLAKDLGADGFELNGSCPNQEGELLCYDPQKTMATCYTVREAVGDDMYGIIKVPRLGEMHIRHLKRLGLPVDGIVCLNALKQSPMINPDTREPFVPSESGYVGRSGPAIRKIARTELRAWLRSTTETSTTFPVRNPDYDIWSVGGVDNGYEAYDRVHNIGALAAGGAQELRRAKNPLTVIRRWGEEYEEAAAQGL